MGVMSDLRSLSAAEEFFDYLDVPYEPEMLRVCRLHIMRQLGNLLRDDAALEACASDEGARAHFRDKLSQAYEDLASEGPLSRRLFKVHQEAVEPKPEAGPSPAFVPLSSIVEPK